MAKDSTLIDARTAFDTAHSELRRLGSCDDMVRCALPRRYATGDNLMMWRSRPGLCGLVLWNRVSCTQIGVLERVCDGAAHRPIERPCDFILDVRRLRGLDSDIYDALIGSATRRLPEIQRRVRRQAVLCSSQLIAGLVSGFHVTLGANLEWRMFTELTPALAWLDEPRPDALGARLEELAAQAISGSGLLDRVRATLAAAGGTSALLDDVSRSVGLSRRSLQRALRSLGTSFRDEVSSARVELGKRLLLETDRKIAAIADHLGFSNEANFVASFRHATGDPPAAWRREHRDLARLLFRDRPCRADSAC